MLWNDHTDYEIPIPALIVYEYLLTIQSEHRVIWGRKLTVPTALFLINRYSLLLLALSISLWAFVAWSSDAVSRMSLCFL